ncbi:MAG: hypothetical protein ACXWJT_02825, partial [Xanthobacteraceae bacterium]
MRKTLMAIVAAISIFIATLSTPTKVEARCYGCWGGAAVGLGLIGAIIAGGAYGYGPGYGYAPAYYCGYGYGYAPAYYGGYGY